MVRILQSRPPVVVRLKTPVINMFQSYCCLYWIENNARAKYIKGLKISALAASQDTDEEALSRTVTPSSIWKRRHDKCVRDILRLLTMVI